jgi:hypothetical protein
MSRKDSPALLFSSRTRMANLEPSTSHNSWSNISVSGVRSLRVRLPSRSLSSTLTLSNRGRWRYLIRCGFVIRRIWPLKVFKE